ncbi:MAG: hypothetical protein ACPGVN_05440 [Alphaproteobacteria bacterium]
MTRQTYIKICETFGSVIAIVYALLIASNTGNEVLGFTLLLVSALAFSVWAVLDKRWAFLVLQAFYIATALLGIWRWG